MGTLLLLLVNTMAVTLQQQDAERVAFAEPIHVGKAGSFLYCHLERHDSPPALRQV